MQLELKLGPAARLIAEKAHYATGTCFRDQEDRPCSQSSAVAFDALGALWKAYDMPAEERRFYSKRVFDLCQARFGHKRIGRLDWDEAFELLRDSGV